LTCSSSTAARTSTHSGPPVPEADQPRKLPEVKPGESQPVDLGAVFNQLGITKDGGTFDVNKGFDAGGASFSAEILGLTQTWKNVEFKIGPPDVSDIVSCHGQIVTLPAGQFSSLWLLGSAVQGDQMDQIFTVTYADGTTLKLHQNMSDWYQPQTYPGQGRALKMAYRNMADGTKDARPFYAYAYGFNLDPTKTVKSLTLPDNNNVEIMSVSLAK
jgi:hypothetical protein